MSKSALAGSFVPGAGHHHSQGNQDYIIRRIFEAIGTTNRFYVEFGFNTPNQCGGSGPNTCKLWLAGWKGLLLDGTNDNPAINLHREYISSRNIADLFRKYNVPTTVDYVSIDIDSTDLWIMKALLSSEFRPRLLSVEYNANYPVRHAISFPDPEVWSTPHPLFDGNCYMGASAAAIVEAADALGYSLVDVTPNLDVHARGLELSICARLACLLLDCLCVFYSYRPHICGRSLAAYI